MRSRIRHLRVKIKSLAAEARIIRAEEVRTHGVERRSLYEHRIGVVREAARNALLAYAFLRGLEYHRIERKCLVEPEWEQVSKLAERFGAVWDLDKEESHGDFEARRAEEKQRLTAWLAEAQRGTGSEERGAEQPSAVA